jgi:PIN domain nuclease of toxin-antitoxin system
VSRFLVDTQLLLWTVSASRKLPARVARLFRDGRHEFFFSAASVWEMAIKAARGRGDFVADVAEVVRTLEENGFNELPVRSSHAVAAGELPALHGDPFDRMLVAQAMVEPMALITADERLAAYPATVEVVR